MITSGPYEFRFTEATAQHKKDFGGAPYWEVVMIGEGRTTGTESSSPKYFGADSMFVSKDDVTQQVVVSESVRMGEGRSYDRQLSARPDHRLRRIGAGLWDALPHQR